MTLKAKLIGLAEINTYLVKVVPALKRGIERNMNDLARLIVNDVKINYLTKRSSPTEPKLNARTGKLRRSINYKVYTNEGVTTAVIGTNVFYGRINHEGATVPAHRIYPKNKKALAWLPQGDSVNRFQAGAIKAFSRNKKNFKRSGGLSASGRSKAKRGGLFRVAKYVNIPTFKIPARPFLSASLEANKLIIVKRMFFEMQRIYGSKS